MSKLLIAILFILIFSVNFIPITPVFPIEIGKDNIKIQEVDASVRVKGYYRKNGTYVKPHYRSNPDGNPYNNWSFPGNTNPYTGDIAPGNPDTYLKNYSKKSGNVIKKNKPLINLPKNARISGSSWVCNTGYVKIDNKCISHTQNCINHYGSNVYGVKGIKSNSSCYCKSGYEWNNNDKNSCVVSIVCPANSTKIDQNCICNTGYVKIDNKCISHTQNCINHYGSNVYGIKGDKNNSSCYCKSGYEWNVSTTACIKEKIIIQYSNRLTAADLNAQINELLSQLNTLQQLLNEIR